MENQMLDLEEELRAILATEERRDYLCDSMVLTGAAEQAFANWPTRRD
jgi:hypothetical protein